MRWGRVCVLMQPGQSQARVGCVGRAGCAGRSVMDTAKDNRPTLHRSHGGSFIGQCFWPSRVPRVIYPIGCGFAQRISMRANDQRFVMPTEVVVVVRSSCCSSSHTVSHCRSCPTTPHHSHTTPHPSRRLGRYCHETETTMHPSVIDRHGAQHNSLDDNHHCYRDERTKRTYRQRRTKSSKICDGSNGNAVACWERACKTQHPQLKAKK